MARAVRMRNFRLRFEVGQRVPEAGERLIVYSSVGNEKRRLTIHKVLRVWQHEDGATLMDADVSQKAV